MDPDVPPVLLPTEVPQVVLEEIFEKVWTYTAPFFVVDAERPVYSGTATCVAAKGKDYLLTAAHVWRRVRGDRFALALDADRPLIPIYSDLVEATLFEPAGPVELGPDLALIRLPDVDSAKIRRVKAFYNLDRRRPEPGEHARYDEGLWGIIGAPAEMASFGETEALFKPRLFFSIVLLAERRGDFDYVELGFDHEGRSDLPRSYGGLSGSGLWQASIARSDSGAVSWTGEVRLEGVAYFQKFTSANQGMVHCHGRASIYQQALMRAVDKNRSAGGT